MGTICCDLQNRRIIEEVNRKKYRTWKKISKKTGNNRKMMLIATL
jgi:hypothetical protein